MCICISIHIHIHIHIHKYTHTHTHTHTNTYRRLASGQQVPLARILTEAVEKGKFTRTHTLARTNPYKERICWEDAIADPLDMQVSSSSSLDMQVKLGLDFNVTGPPKSLQRCTAVHGVQGYLELNRNGNGSNVVGRGGSMHAYDMVGACGQSLSPSSLSPSSLSPREREREREPTRKERAFTFELNTKDDTRSAENTFCSREHILSRLEA